MSSSINDKIAIVTGASSGVGKAIATALAAHGARLCLLGRRRASLEAVAQASGSRVMTYQVDLERDEDVMEFAAQFRKDCDKADILIHSAGAISMGRIDQARIQDLDRQYRVNVRAPYLLTQAVLPLLRACQGQVVFINSTAGLGARANVGQYAATKHALTAIADSLREECNAEGVRVLSVYLGRTASPMQADVHKAEGKEYRPERLIQPEDVAAVVINALNLPRTAEVTEIRIRPLKKPE